MNADTSIVVVDHDDARVAPLLRALDALPYQVRRVATLGAATPSDLTDVSADILMVHADAIGANGGNGSASPWGTTGTGASTSLLVYAHEADELRGSILEGLRDFVLAPFEPVALQARVEAVLAHARSRADRADDAKREELLKLERDLQIGRTIQQGFLPTTLPQPPGWEINAFFQPAREVAGDFYDAFFMVNKRRVGFIIADVCDKGVGAALFMSLFRTLLRSNAQHTTSLGWMDPGSGSVTDDKDWLMGDPAKRRQSLPNIGTGALMNAVVSTNDYITENHMEQGYFATMFFGVLDPATGALVYINGGHNPPVLHRADGTQTFLKPTGPAVGMLPGVKFKMGQTRLGPGDTLFTYTDGVTDARSADGAFFTEQRLFELVGHGAATATDLVSGVKDQLTAHIGDAPQFDDITMLALRRASDAAPSESKPDDAAVVASGTTTKPSA